MRLPFASRLAAVLFALLSMLLMQLAGAACACSGMTEDSDTGVMMSVKADMVMPGCHGNMLMPQAKICHIHADDLSNKQFLDKAELPAVAPFIPVGLVLTIAEPGHDRLLWTSAPALPLFTRATAPPIAIRNCCFRI